MALVKACVMKVAEQAERVVLVIKTGFSLTLADLYAFYRIRTCT
jgi:hypothetical protein